jgi:hypothetical protein
MQPSHDVYTALAMPHTCFRSLGMLAVLQCNRLMQSVARCMHVRAHACEIPTVAHTAPGHGISCEPAHTQGLQAVTTRSSAWGTNQSQHCTALHIQASWLAGSELAQCR